MTARRRRPERTFMQHAEAMNQPDDYHQRIRALEALGPGLAIYKIKVFEDINVVTVGDGKFKFDIPEDLDGAELLKAEAWITGASSSGPVEVQLHNDTQGVDMLSTKLSIDVGELNSKDAATPHVVNLANDDVEWGDEIWINVDAAGVGALGLGITLYFAHIDTSKIGITGTPGPPGGVTNFEGDWVITTTYNAGDIIIHNGVAYIVTVTHVADGDSEPGVGVDWEDFLAPLISNIPTESAIELVINGNNYPIDIGIKGFAEVPYDCEIVRSTLLADIAGSMVVDIWKDTYGAFPPTNADSITSASPPTLSGAAKTQDTSLTGWTTSLLEGDILAFNIDSCTLITKATLSLKLVRS